MVRRGPLMTAVWVSFAAVPGTTIHGTSAPPSAAGTPPTTGTSWVQGEALVEFFEA